MLSFIQLIAKKNDGIMLFSNVDRLWKMNQQLLQLKSQSALMILKHANSLISK